MNDAFRPRERSALTGFATNPLDRRGDQRDQPDAVARYRASIVQAAAVTLADAAPGRSAKQAEPYAVGLLGAGEALARWWLDRGGSLPFATLQKITHALVDGALATWRSSGRP